jgi:hypothetical protein
MNLIADILVGSLTDVARTAYTPPRGNVIVPAVPAVPFDATNVPVTPVIVRFTMDHERLGTDALAGMTLDDTSIEPPESNVVDPDTVTSFTPVTATPMRIDRVFVMAGLADRAVRVTVPKETPVTTPDELTVATPLLSVDHVMV